MQLKTFTVSAFEPGEDEGALNSFLRGHRILEVRQEFFAGSVDCPHWLFAVSYMEADPASKPKGRTGNKRERIDYKAVLGEAAFARFAKLREQRKAWAERDGVPVYAVYTNEQLAAMVEPVAQSKADLLKIEGIGDAKWEKYGAATLEVLKHETSETATTQDRGSRESA